MRGIFGIFQRDGKPVEPLRIDTMCKAMENWTPNGCSIWRDGCSSLGQGRLDATQMNNDRLYVEADAKFVFTAQARIDNRKELLTDLGLYQPQALAISDAELIRQSYLRWGEDCVQRIYGDWSFAAYHPLECKLFLARDHYGRTALYYYEDPHIFVFASSRKALLKLNLAPLKMDELYLGQVVISWPAYHDGRTVYSHIKRLPPAHCMTVTPKGLNIRLYWDMQNVTELRLPNRQDYVSAFKEIFFEAVKARLRTTDNAAKIAVTLSGGLDSGSVAVTAAHFLQAQGRRLTAYTSVPLSETQIYIGKERFGDEFFFAQATALRAGNIDLYPITTANINPIQGIRHMLQIRNEPAHAAGNFFWMHDLMQTAMENDCRVLLTGQSGNGSISWIGSIFSQPLAFQLRHFGWRWVKEAIKYYAPVSILQKYQKIRITTDNMWQSSSINPDFAKRINLFDQMLSNPYSFSFPKQSPLERRFAFIHPGRSLIGSLWAENSAAYGLEILDPTSDVRVMTFTLSVPDSIFMDSRTGLDRWLIREAMKNYLPDEVRLNRKRGRQAADLVPRLRKCAAEVEAVLEELEKGIASFYLNIPYMRKVWQMIQTQDTPEAFHKSITILTRGIMAGLFVNNIGNI
ncbi:MAG: asparagine synthetase B [Desulfobacterales bacterium]|nr:asparagine synthetase B [Desulfobacterales bacterium]